MANLAAQVSSHYNGVAAFNVYQYNVSYYSVADDQKTVDVTFDDCQGKGYVPAQLYESDQGAVFKAVPIPDDAQPAQGADGELSIYQPATDRLWELWKANRQDDGWHACWGGRLDDASLSPGYFDNDTGVAATGLSVTGGAIGLAEAAAGNINHAMSLNVVDADSTELSYPAQRGDGNLPGGEAGIPEGQRFRLPADMDVTSLNLSPVATAIARAAQKYGFIVNDRAGAVSVIAIEQPGPTSAGMTWASAMGNSPSYAVLKGFPWERLQALPHDYQKPQS